MSRANEFSVGDSVWFYDPGLYPIEAIISSVVRFGDMDGGEEGTAMCYGITHDRKTLESPREVAPHRLWARPAGRGQLLKKMSDDIEFLNTCREEIAQVQP